MNDASPLLMTMFAICFLERVIKVIPLFEEHHSRYTSLEVLRDVYRATSGEPSLIHAVAPPHLNSRGSYVVELEPLGLPVSGAPSNEASVREAVRGVLRGLSILHKSGKIF